MSPACQGLRGLVGSSRPSGPPAPPPRADRHGCLAMSARRHVLVRRLAAPAASPWMPWPGLRGMDAVDAAYS
eukprot:11191205-Lingulodinium_polyedra.AAC.1